VQTKRQSTVHSVPSSAASCTHPSLLRTFRLGSSSSRQSCEKAIRFHSFLLSTTDPWLPYPLLADYSMIRE
jgi:hypothetical protein